MVTIGVLEFDKVGHMSFDTFHRGAAAPINPFGCKLRLPFGKLFRPPDVETDVAQRRFRSRTCCYSVLILIRPYISDLPVRRFVTGNPSMSHANFSNLSRSVTSTPTCTISWIVPIMDLPFKVSGTQELSSSFLQLRISTVT